MFCDERGGEIVAASKTQQEAQGRNPMYGGAHCLLVPFLDSVQHPQVMMGFFILSQKRASHSQQPDGGDVSAQQAPPCPFSPFVIRRLSSAEQDPPGTYLFHVPRFLFVENRLHSASLTFPEFQRADSISFLSGKGGKAKKQKRSIQEAIVQPWSMVLVPLQGMYI